MIQLTLYAILLERKNCSRYSDTWFEPNSKQVDAFNMAIFAAEAWLSIFPYVGCGARFVEPVRTFLQTKQDECGREQRIVTFSDENESLYGEDQ